MTVGAHRYIESGLPDVILENVETRVCGSCGARSVVLPHVTGLHRSIALELVRKEARLSGVEIRYLRKSLGLSGVDFSRIIGVSASTVSNWETDKLPIGPQSDRVLRLLVVRGAPVESYPIEDLAKIADAEANPMQVRLKLKGTAWAAPAA